MAKYSINANRKTHQPANPTRHEIAKRTNSMTPTSPLVSIITPCYQGARFIEETIKSVRDQSYSNIEYIIIDGGSTDETAEIVERYRDVVNIFISEPDDGQADAIRKGFDVAKGEIIAWINADDTLETDSVAIAVEAFSEGKADAVYGDMNLIDSSGDKIGERCVSPFPRLGRLHGFIHGTLGLYQPATFWTYELYKKSGGIDPKFQFAMDIDLFVKFVATGARFRYLDRKLANFRVHDDSKTSTLRDVALEDQQTIITAWPQKSRCYLIALKTYDRLWKLSYHLIKRRFRYLFALYSNSKYRFVP